ncbi:neuronal acetylcholine receptor subunit alpha-3 isoform X1 [Manduca sexta]|uniref:neuronal acetylcholine receptor subunit alpha-3 isoform X1 n=1 Tax=Manduca sexta TaxID=7130 RepID=UPI00188F3694|nr:neuronal acetylcholine receptor subunit alpha-3 isoform X1 [Manduca sexta]
MAPRVHPALLLLLFCVSNARCECDNTTLLSLQIDALLAVYDRETPPAARHQINASMDVRHATINEIDSTARMLADLKLSWNDPRLSWNATEWDCSGWMVPAERLWLPDVVVMNAAATSAGDVSLRARLDSDGTVLWIKRLDLTAPVQLQLRDWPRDVQDVTFKFGSRMHSVQELDIVVIDVKNSLVFEAGAWEMLSMSSESTLWNREGMDLRVVTWTVHVRRRAPAHALATGVVLIAALIMLAGATALPPLQRPPLAAAAALLTVVWLVWWGSRGMAAGSCPAAAVAMCSACVLAALLGACAALVGRVASCTTAPPRLLRALLSRVSGLCDLTPHSDTLSSEQSAAWAASARLLDRTLLVLFHLTGFIIAVVYF